MNNNYSTQNIKKVTRYLLIFFLLLISYDGESQSRRFKHLTSIDGISQSEVYCFLEDSRGFMWFGTVDGLNRYDGYNIEIFNTRKNDPHSLSNNTIRSLAEDQSGRIWIGTDDGLNMYDPETELIYQLEVKAFKNKLPVWSLLVHEGQLFMGTHRGLWRTIIKNHDLNEIASGFQEIKEYPHSGQLVWSVIKSKSGGIWILTSDNISRIVFQQNSSKPILVDDFDEFSSASSIVEDFSGNIWVALSRNGIIRYNPQTKEARHFVNYGKPNGPSSKKCSSLALDKHGNLWIGTLDKGLNIVNVTELNKEEVRFESIQKQPFFSYSLNSNLIHSLYVSKDNLLWIGTIGSGVNIFNPDQKKFKHYKFRELTNGAPNSNFIRSVYADDQNRIWTGTHNNGLFLFDRKDAKFKKLGFETQTVFFIADYKENKKFVCTGHGLFLVEVVNDKIKILSNVNNTEEPSAVFNVVKSKPGVYWYAAINGLVRVKVIDDKIIFDRKYNVSTNPDISNNNCRVLFYDENNNKLLLGTEGGGLNIVTLDDNHYAQKIESYTKTTDSGSISNNYVRSIIKDRNENIWIGTYEGLNKMVYDPSGKITFQSYKKKDGLPNNMIQLLIEDNNHNIWIGTNGGLSQFFPEEKRFVNYTYSDGLQSNEFSEHTVFKRPDGEIIIGGINGINAFYPEQIEISTQAPRTTITNFYLFNEQVRALEKTGKKVLLPKSITLTDSILLLPKQKNIGFEFSAMVYPNAEKIRYAYMLEGFDNNWHYTDAGNRIANYTNLSHGKYTFKVKSTNSDGVWNESAREIFVHIQTPFVYTWFAYIIYALIIVLLFVYFSHYTVIRYTTKKKLLLEKEHNDKLHELDVLRTKFFINISHDLRTPLSLIQGPLNVLLKNNRLSTDVKDSLQLIKRNVKRLNYLIEQLLDVRKAESGKLSAKLQTEDIVSFTNEEVAHFTYAVQQRGLTLNVYSNPEKIEAGFDKAMLSKVYFNIISNAIKFTEKGKIEISIENVEKESYEILKNAPFDTFVKVQISDTGRGISKEQNEKLFDRFYQGKTQSGNGYGIGLSHTKELIDAHQGYIEVANTGKVGTTIHFFLPNIEIQDKKLKNSAGSTEDIYVNAEEVMTGGEEKGDDTKKTILIVEDNADMRSFIRTALKHEYNVIEASDGLEGLKQVNHHHTDLIVCDVMMPNMDGIELCEKIKSNLETSHIPFILLTAKVDQETRYDGIKTGADDYIPKPFEMEYLTIRIKNLLESREKLRRLFQKGKVMEPSAVTVTSVDEKFLTSLMEAIDDGIPDSEFSVNSLESKMAMSHAKFYRKIKSLTGHSGQELLLNMRMKRAHQILSEKKGIRVAEVAYMVGFTNPKYFSKCFKAKYGFAPSELMK